MAASSHRMVRPMGAEPAVLQQHLPPHALDFEEAILGGLLLEYNHCYHEVCHLLRPEIFYKESHGCIYAAIESLTSKGAPVDLLTVTQELRMLGKLESVGGAYYITQLTERVASSANIVYHASIVFQKYVLRSLIRESLDILRFAYMDSIDAFALSENAVERMESINNLSDSNLEESSKSLSQRTRDTVLEVSRGNKPPYYETGFPTLDEVVGISPNEILLLAGPAGHGKTRLLIAVMDRLLKKYPNISIQWFSFEDPADKIIRCFAGVHMLMKEARIRGKRGKLSKAETEEFVEYMDRIYSTFDIEFVQDQKFIKQVHHMFVTFCKKRENRMNICIIDNLLLLEDNTADRDDIIAKEMVKMRKKTGGLILPVHHFNDEQMAKEMIKQAYRPRLVHLKGRESYRRSCTQILLVNKPGNYADLVMEYKGQEDILKSLYLIEVAKNRDDSANDDNLTLIRMFCDLDLISFEEL